MIELPYESPIGTLIIVEDGGAICGIRFRGANRACLSVDAPPTPNRSDAPIAPPTPLLKRAAAQLGEYFNGARKAFDLPIALSGAPFSLKVWSALQEIPYGETRSYGEVAAMVGNPKAPRAVGMANNRNPLPIIVPCHRVIGADGSLTGYAGGLEAKRFLLELEGALL
jgi:O-6-methylguanine DNA methyltransferase